MIETLNPCLLLQQIVSALKQTEDQTGVHQFRIDPMKKQLLGDELLDRDSYTVHQLVFYYACIWWIKFKSFIVLPLLFLRL